MFLIFVIAFCLINTMIRSIYLTLILWNLESFFYDPHICLANTPLAQGMATTGGGMFGTGQSAAGE